MASTERSGYLIFDDMTWPDPTDPKEVAWRLRYGQELTQQDRYYAALVIEAYYQIFVDGTKVRNKKMTALRKAYAEAVNAHLG